MANLAGSAPNQLPSNGHLGGMAFQSPEAVTIKPQASATPQEVGDLVIQATSNTSLTFKLKGTDGTVRTGSITLA
jgi:hypothetical protein